MSSNISIDLSPIVRAVDQVSQQVDSGFTQIAFQFSDIDTKIVTTNQQLNELRARFEDYVLQAERVANVQRAETKLSGLKDDLDREFGHHNVVRRTSVGILQAFDVGNVSNRTVGQVSEELMIQTPRYWLAPALVALAAWSKHDEEMSTRSLEEAFRRDPRKTSLFFALVLRRQKRFEGSIRWLRQYLMGLDPMSLSREFVVVLECVNLGAFGPDGVVLAADRINEWNEQLRNDPEVVESQVDTWMKFIGTHRQQLDVSSYPLLSQVSPQWHQVQELLESVSALPNAIEWFEAARDRVDQRSNVAEDVLDDILESLVTEFDADELPVRREILYNESVIEENGSLDRARERAEALQNTLEDQIDVVSLQTAAAMSPDELGVGAGTQRTAIGTGRQEAVAGVGRFTLDYRSRVMTEISIELSPHHTGFASNFGFPGWGTTTSVTDNDAVNHLAWTWDQTIAKMRESLRFKPTTMILPIVIAAVVFVIAVLINPVAGITVFLLGAGVVGLMWYLNKSKADAAVANLEASKQQAIAESVSMYRAAIAEFADAGMLYRELDEQEGELLEILQGWPMGQLEVPRGNDL